MHCIKSTIGVILLFGLFSSTPAHACRSAASETHLNIFSKEAIDTVSEGNLQFKVELIEPRYWMEKYSSDFTFVRVLEGKYARNILMIKNPIVTSCDRMAVYPKAEILYLSGQFARVNGEPMTISGGLLFAIDPITIKRTRGGFRQRIQSDDVAD